MRGYAVSRRLVPAVLAAFVFAAAACGGSDESSSQAAADAADGGGEELQKVEVMFPYQESIFFLGELIAQENGYFADEGIELKVLPSEGGSFVVQQIVAGKVKFGITSPEPFLIAAAQDLPLKAIMETDRGTVFIAAPVDGDIDSLEDLRGKELGISDVGGGEVGFVELVLEKLGLTEDVKLRPVGAGGPTVHNALKTGRIAAYAGFTNDLAGVEAAGLKLKNILPAEYDSLPGDVVVVTDETLRSDQDRETIIKVMRAWNRGTQFALDDPEKALEIACGRVPEECQDKSVAQSFMDITLEAVKPREGKPLGAFDLKDTEIVQEGLVESDQMPKPVELEKFLLDDYLDELQP
jgi:NitT/TauT family transport system substrate-binding protein